MPRLYSPLLFGLPAGILRLALTLCVCCGFTDLAAQHGHLLHKTYARRFPYLLDFYEHGLLNMDSVTAFAEIDAIKKLALDNGDDDLLMEAKLMRVHYYYYRHDFPADRLFAMMDSLKRESMRQNRVWAEALLENMAALTHFSRLGNYEKGFEHHERVYYLIKDLDPADFPHKQSCLYQMADQHFFFSDYAQSIFYLKQALAADSPHRQYRYGMAILNTLGLSYQKLGLLDSSDYYFGLMRARALQNGDRVWEAIGAGNVGHNFFLRGDYARARPLLVKDAETALTYGDYGLASGAYMGLGHMALNEHRYAEAESLLTRGREYAYRSARYERLETLYPLLSKLYAVKGDAPQSMMFLDSALFVRDSLARRFNTLQMTRAKQKVELERHRAELQNIENQKNANILQRNVLIALVLLVFVAAWLLLASMNQRHRRRRERMDAQLRQAESELAFASGQLADFTRNISEKNDLIQTMQARLGEGAQTAVEELQRSIILTEDDWVNFKILFQRVHPQFFANLAQKYPEMTPGEVRFLALCKLNISTREMAAMLGVSMDAIRKLRHRLRKKLQTSNPDVELEFLVLSL